MLIGWRSSEGNYFCKLPTSALSTSSICSSTEPSGQWPIDNIIWAAPNMAQFIPRAIFPNQVSLPRSYFLGHHAAGLSKMKTMLSSIDLIIECRDYRVPLTSRNPLFEESLAGRERVILYTKRDLGSKGRPSDKKVYSSLHYSSTFTYLELIVMQCVERRNN